MKNFIMLLTYSRIFLGPIIFFLSVFLNLYLISLILFIFCSISDFLDGFLARKFNRESILGKILDPIADKILLCSSILSITVIANDNYIGLMGVLILIREFWVSGLREFNAVNNNSSASNVSFLAKTKTTIQFIAITSFYYSFHSESSLGIFISSWILFLSLIISTKTALNYSKNSFLIIDRN